MEFEALLAGLQAILDMQDWKTKDHERLRATRPLVWWETDCEHLALASWRSPNGDIKEGPYYRRKNWRDLWPRFEFYERLFTITPAWQPRNTDAIQALTDKIAGYGRNMMKEAWPALLNKYPEIPR